MSAKNLDNLAVWLDIPVVDLDRAMEFYKAVIARDIQKDTSGDISFAFVDHGPGNGACLVPGADLISDKGPLVYLNVDGRIREAVERTKENGGKILSDVQSIGPHGFKAEIIDSEGNRIALHSNTDS